MNLSEDISIELKIVKRSIVKFLISLLDRTSTELLIVVVGFLTKLSLYKENVDDILQVFWFLLKRNLVHLLIGYWTPLIWTIK